MSGRRDLPDARAGVVAVEHPWTNALVAFLRTRKVDIGTYQSGVFRVDPHAFCIADDVDRLLVGLDEFADRPSRISTE